MIPVQSSSTVSLHIFNNTIVCFVDWTSVMLICYLSLFLQCPLYLPSLHGTMQLSLPVAYSLFCQMKNFYFYFRYFRFFFESLRYFTIERRSIDTQLYLSSSPRDLSPVKSLIAALQKRKTECAATSCGLKMKKNFFYLNSASVPGKYHIDEKWEIWVFIVDILIDISISIRWTQAPLDLKFLIWSNTVYSWMFVRGIVCHLGNKFNCLPRVK